MDTIFPGRHPLDRPLRSPRTFTRASVAYLDGQEYAVDVPRYREIAVSGISDGEWPASGYIPMAIVNGVLVGTEADTYVGIFTSTDGGDTWVQTSDINCLFVWALASGALLISTTGGPGNEVCLYRSAPGQLGADLSQANLYGKTKSLSYTYDEVSGEFTYPDYWNVAQGPSGTILASEYCGATNAVQFGKKIYRSTDDGVSFALCYTEAEAVRHMHAVRYHVATGRWVQVIGDGDVNKMVCSDDDGVTWADLPGHGNPGIPAQPVWLLEYGDATKLLCGSDEFLGVFTLDVLTGEMIQLYHDLRPRQMHVFALGRHEGVFYAVTEWDSVPGGTDLHQVLLASADLEHWAVHHHFTADEFCSGPFVGYAQGKLHFTLMNSTPAWRHFRISPTSPRVMRGLVLEPATANLLNEEASDRPQYYKWQVAGCTLVESTEYARHGPAAGKMQAAAGVKLCATWPWDGLFVAVPGHSYRFKCWLYSPNNLIQGYLHVISTPSYVPIGEDRYFALGPWWQQVESGLVLCPAGENGLAFQLYFATEANGTALAYIDCAQVEECITPTTWQIGGTPRAAEVLTEPAMMLPARGWTNVLWIAPGEHWVAEGEYWVKTWKAGATDLLTLRYTWDTSAWVVKLEQDGGLLTSEAWFSGVTWQKHGWIGFGITGDSTGGRVALVNGGAVQFANFGALPASMLGAAVTPIRGDAAGANLFPHALLADRVIGRRASDAELSRWLDPRNLVWRDDQLFGV